MKLVSVPVWCSGVIARHDGGIAQLGERLHGMQEVIGSIPFTSTIWWPEQVVSLVLSTNMFYRRSPLRLEA